LSEKIHFTTGERLSAAIGMTVGLLGLINWATWQWTVFGLSQKQMLIGSFVPMMLIVFYISPEDRLQQVRNE
jgi:hypothetical protein